MSASGWIGRGGDGHPNVICIGECMVEVSARHDETYGLGFAGDTLNTAVYLKRSAPKVGVHFLTVTGTEQFSRAMRAAWRAEGIEEDLAYTVEQGVPGLYVISLDSSGERSFTYWRSTSPARQWLDRLLHDGGVDRLASADMIYFSGISLGILPPQQRSLALQMIASVRQRGCRIAFDPNYRQALWESTEVARETLEAAAEVADILLPSEEDLSSAGLRMPMERECITTRGARGCSIRIDGSESLVNAPPATAGRIVDTSGAGDSFNGAYLAARLTGADPSAAATAALAVAARVVSASGAIVPREVSHPTLVESQ